MEAPDPRKKKVRSPTAWKEENDPFRVGQPASTPEPRSGYRLLGMELT